MKRCLKMILSGVLLCTMLSSCTIVKTQIAYTVYPVGYLLQRLGGDTITVQTIQSDTIVQRATIRDDYESILKNSAVFLHIGQLEPYLSLYSSQINAAISSQIDLSSMNAVYDFKRYTEVEADGQSTFVESPYYKGDEFSMIDTDEKDLYLWSDPIAMLSMAKDIRDWLVKTFPNDQAVYQENFTKLETDLINLDAQYQNLSTTNETNHKEIRFVSMTASFGNWQKTYGFQVYPIILSKYGALPNAEQLKIIEDRIKTDQVKYIVYEPNMTDDMIQLFDQVQSDLNLTRVELSNLSSLTDTQTEAGKDYISIMYENLSVLQTMTQDRQNLPSETESVSGSSSTSVTQETTPAPTATPKATATATAKS